MAAEPGDGQRSLWQKGRFAETRIIGQYHDTYIVCESDQGMVLVDQHAAHERILFEQLQGRSTKNGPRSQKLLLPETIELGYREAAALEKLTVELNRIGFDIEPFGGNTFVIKSVPAMLSGKDIKPIVVEIAEKAATVGFGTEMEKALDQYRMLMACHGAIRANQPLQEGEIRQLLVDLDQCHNPSHCPHGRPTFIRWTVKELEKAFHRV